MKWIKQGRIFCPSGEYQWAMHSALQPTPLMMDSFIRMYVGFRDNEGVSRIGYLDLSTDDPSKILGISTVPALDVGKPGTFDENGVVPCAVIRREEKIYLYYAGYQRGQKVRFYVFSGVAVSEDGGSTFQRSKQVPLLERTDEALLFRVIHTILFEKNRWRAWYGAGSYFIDNEGVSLPVYDIWHMVSKDGFHFGKAGNRVLTFKDDDEYRVGRPYVMKAGETYKMFYAMASKKKSYRLGYAESCDGVAWVRKDAEVGIGISEMGWDSEMIAYPSIVNTDNQTYLFYNGNEMGKTGFGYAILDHHVSD